MVIRDFLILVPDDSMSIDLSSEWVRLGLDHLLLDSIYTCLIRLVPRNCDSITQDTRLIGPGEGHNLAELVEHLLASFFASGYKMPNDN